MINGVHAIIFSDHAEGLRAFFRDVLELPSVDAGGGWLIFALPPAELAAHPDGDEGRHELYLMCDDIQAEYLAIAAPSMRRSGRHELCAWARLRAGAQRSCESGLGCRGS